jgi:putative sterol carrier protein
MTSEIFSAEWAKAWKRAIDSHAGYRVAAATWEGSLALEMRDPSGAATDRAVYVDLWHGTCRGARVAVAEDLATAGFVLSGSTEIWRRVLRGEVAPLMAIMTGRLTLTRGSLAALIPYAAAAKALVDAAAGVPARFPGEAAP